MSGPGNDEQRWLDEFAAGESPSVVPLPEDDPMAAFAVEQAEDALEWKAAASPRRARPGLRGVLAPAAVVAAVLTIAAVVYVYPPKPASPVERVARVRFTEVVVPAPAATERATTSGDSPLLSGDWVMNTRVESSRLKRYEGLRLGYRVRLRQNGERVSGIGWKVSEDERPVGTSGQTPIRFDGVMKGDRLELTFKEEGRLRTSGGTLELARDSDDVLRGRFSSTAAHSLGAVEIHR